MTCSTRDRLPPHRVLARHYRDERGRRARVRRLFDASAPHYDWINSVMSFGSGAWYRDQVLRRHGLSAGMRALDVGSGTGVLAAKARGIVGPTGSVIALDPSRGMLAQARTRVPVAVRACGERLPLADASVDFLSMGYALRHVPDLRATFREYRRVLRPGGRLLLLEITPPRSRAARAVLRLYLRRVIPALSGLRNTASRELMSYYWDTIVACVPPAAILAALRSAGFTAVERQVSLGIFSEYVARTT